MQKANNALLMLMLTLSPIVWSQPQAQPQPQTMLSDAIQVAKTRKAADIALNLSAYNIKPAATGESGTSLKTPLELPKLWSIRGVGNALYAEVIYQGRIHEVSLVQEDNLRVGDWLLVGLTTQEALFTHLAGSAHPMRKEPVKLRLSLTASIKHINDLSAQPSTGSTLAESAPLTSNANPARPPVPFELLRP